MIVSNSLLAVSLILVAQQNLDLSEPCGRHSVNFNNKEVRISDGFFAITCDMYFYPPSTMLKGDIETVSVRPSVCQSIQNEGPLIATIFYRNYSVVSTCCKNLVRIVEKIVAVRGLSF